MVARVQNAAGPGGAGGLDGGAVQPPGFFPELIGGDNQHLRRAREGG
ncbi:MAG: hypothetical protein WKG07_20620 [Hymenobacter sp.]